MSGVIGAHVAAAGGTPVQHSGSKAADWIIFGSLAALFIAGLTVGILYLLRIRRRDVSGELHEPFSGEALAAHRDLVLTLLRDALPSTLVELIDQTPKADRDPIERLVRMFGEERPGEMTKADRAALALAQSHVLIAGQAKELKRLRKEVKRLAESDVTPDRVTVRSAQVMGGILTLLFAFAGCIFAALKALS